MKIKIAILALVLSQTNLLTHGGHMAVFNYQVEAKTVLLSFKIETAVLDHFDLENTCENYQVATAMCLAQHIEQNTALIVEGQRLNFELQSSQKDERFFKIEMLAKGTFSNTDKMTIENKCFLEFDQRFENRILLQKEGFQKSYRLNHKHQTIDLNIKDK